MDIPTGLTRSLTAELAALNASQLAAVLHPGSLVVRAGPGSGKTRTLVAKAAYTLEAVIPPRRGLAAITYTRHAASEIVRRLEALNVPAAGRVAAGTVHSWCLRNILQPFGPLVGIAAPAAGQVLDDRGDEWTGLLQQVLDEHGAGGTAATRKTEVCRIRRRAAAGITHDPHDPLVRAAAALETRMLTQGWYDFDLMVSQSLAVLRNNPTVTELVAARFPYLIVDEYQDLGPVLHRIVTHLHASAGVQVAAFGDPDQTIMSFTGASPAYLHELASGSDFLDTTLDINYRCGTAIITASHATIDGSRNHQADPRRADPGVVEIVTVEGEEPDHADMTIAKIDELAANDVEEHHIAVLYPRKGALLDALVAALETSIYDYIHEGDQRLPDGELVEFIRGCAARAIAGPQPIGYPDVDHASAVPTIHELTTAFQQLHDNVDRAAPARRPTSRLLATVLDTVPPETALSPWLRQLETALTLGDLTEHGTQRRDRQALPEVHEIATRHSLSVGDIAGALRTGKVTLTTYHSAKGREWDYVILPGLIDGVMPRRRWHGPSQQHVPVSPDEFEQDRRAFYVGLTRAKRAVILIEGSYFTSRRNLNRYGISPFARLVRARLSGQRTVG